MLARWSVVMYRPAGEGALFEGSKHGFSDQSVSKDSSSMIYSQR